MMPAIQNSVLTTRVIDALFAVVGRRTLDSHALKTIQIVLRKLTPMYGFLGTITVHDEPLTQDHVQITFEPEYDLVDPVRVGRMLEALIQVIYLNLADSSGEDIGLYFITEVKAHLGDSIIDELRKRKVSLEKIQQDRSAKPGSQPEPHEEPTVQPYSWDTVATWKYDENVCQLYDSTGALLDTILLDLLIEEYVDRVSETREEGRPSMRTILRLTDKDSELLAMLKQRDIDVDYALNLLHVSRQKLETMIQKLLQLEMLQFVSETEVKLTEKGLQYLHEKTQQSLNGPL